MCSVSAALRAASAVAASAVAASAVAASAVAASAVADSASAFTSNSEFLLQLLRAILRRFHPLGAQEELHEFLLADLAGRACDLDQFLDEAGELLARYIVIGPAEVAVAMENLGDRLFERLALVRDPFLVLSQLRVLRLRASSADRDTLRRHQKLAQSRRYSNCRSGRFLDLFLDRAGLVHRVRHLPGLRLLRRS